MTQDEHTGARWATVAEASAIAPAQFLADYVAENRPVLIRGGVARWPAIARWTDDYLRQTIGHCRVMVETSADQFEGRMFDDVEEIELTFSQFLDRFDRPEGRYDYFCGHWLKPELAPDIGDQPLINAMGLPYRRRMIMTRGGNRIAMHFDPYENLIAQIAGSKRIILGDPVDGDRLRPLDGKHRNYAAWDARDPDSDQCPDIEHAALYAATLEPGDLLYIPTLWWHTVDSFERNIMISSAFVHSTQTLLRIVERLVTATRSTIARDDARAVQALLARPQPSIKDVVKLAKQRGVTQLLRLLVRGFDSLQS